MLPGGMARMAGVEAMASTAQSTTKSGTAAQTPSLPRSTVQPLTPIVGFITGVLAIWLLAPLDMLAFKKTMLVAALTGLAMVLVDVLVYRVYRNPSAGLGARVGNRFSLHRIVRKLAGLAFTLGIVAMAYWMFPEYHGDFYEPLWQALAWLAPYLIVLTPLYVVLVDRMQSDPEDSYALVGAILLRGELPADMKPVWNHARIWLVKGFFLPLMFVYLTRDLGKFWGMLAPGLPDSFIPWYEFVYSATYVFDLLFAVVGYTLTLRLLDSHVRSAEPSMLGWAVCIVCYQPLWSVFQSGYLNYETDNLYWGGFFLPWPLLHAAWGCTILICVIVYVWATMVFGIRFSNLTYRGIITTGPYRWTKHPAYVSKNLSWWLISLPFINSAGWEEALRLSLLLGLINVIYAVRAWTEERHLASVDPDYVQYQAYMRQHGLFAPLRRLVFGK